MELFLDVLSETLVDTAKMLPFLFLAYLFIEYVETRHGERIEALLAGGGRWGAVPGAVLGCVPQCGFSAIASNFYASRVITLGTLMAVYLATSDEAIPLLVSMPAYWDKLILLIPEMSCAERCEGTVSSIKKPMKAMSMKQRFEVFIGMKFGFINDICRSEM